MIPSRIRVAYRYLLGEELAAAPSAEADFFDNPLKRETREFADSNAVSNDIGVATKAAPELGMSSRKVRREVDSAPPTPLEIRDDVPGSDDFSTLSRLLLETKSR